MQRHFNLPSPNSWEAFEELISDLFQRQYFYTSIQRYGRRGQRQFGVDIVGVIKDGILGIQCKHVDKSEISISDVDEILEKSESFQPKLDKFFIATSSTKNTIVQSHILELKESRLKQNLYSVDILFWEDICNSIWKYSDLILKHFRDYLPTIDQLSKPLFHLDNIVVQKQTVVFPCNCDLFFEMIEKNLQGIELVNPYELRVGFSTFPLESFKDKVDVELDTLEYFQNETTSKEDFQKTLEILKNLQEIISQQPTILSKKIWLYSRTRLTPAFLFGWVFRKVTGFQLVLVGDENVYWTGNLPYVDPKIIEPFPIIGNNDSTDVVVILSISRHIGDSVQSFLMEVGEKPKAIIEFRVENQIITSPAQALSIALSITRKIKQLCDQQHSKIQHIHLFASIPQFLAILIGYHLNAVPPVTLYFRDKGKVTYLEGGTLR